MTTPESVLVTGGAGYVGAHVCAALLAAGRTVVALDDLSNASRAALDRVAAIGLGAAEFVEADVRDGAALDRVFSTRCIAAVVHAAGLKSVAESVADPLHYYDVNVGGAVSLLAAMRRHEVRRLVFSSSATVYGAPERCPVAEDAAVDPINPYGRTKLIVERLIADVADATPGWRAVSLRYFNPVGAHESGLIGEDPIGAPNNLFPYVAQTAIGRREAVRVFGDDYPTRDGTGVRDYIHVVDLAEGHLAALDWTAGDPGARGGVHRIVNLGSGIGYSVLEVLEAFGRACGRPIPYRTEPRRPGDAPACVADTALAHALLDWRARRDLDAMCADHWRWQSLNPDGYPAAGIGGGRSGRASA